MIKSPRLRLGVNIDHVATIRNARGGAHPDPARAALLAQEAGADGITLHVREDRRHVREDDLERIAAAVSLPINLEMACSDEMLAIALKAKPHAVCLVPERRAERTTEGGLDVAGAQDTVARYVDALSKAGIRVSLFIDPDVRQVEAAWAVGAPVIELHTGAYCEALRNKTERAEAELQSLKDAARAGAELGLEVHAGHGIDYESVTPIAAMPEIAELNIGHFLIGEAVFTGLSHAIGTMRRLMDEARA
jgi:pyridoxine 5-phosphate synthase